MLYFVTGNQNKFREAKAMIPELEQLVLNLPEIQSLDPRKIIERKLADAMSQGIALRKGLKAIPYGLVVEDVSLYAEALHDLPGPLIKWFEKGMGVRKFAEIINKLGNSSARVEVMLGYAKDNDNIQYFLGEVSGTIVAPRGNEDFGFDCIFQPKGHNKTYGEMVPDEKNTVSHRAIAFSKLRDFLKK